MPKIAPVFACFSLALALSLLVPALAPSAAVVAAPSPAIIATVPVGAGPIGVAVNPSPNRVYVADWNSNTVSPRHGMRATHGVASAYLVAGETSHFTLGHRSSPQGRDPVRWWVE